MTGSHGAPSPLRVLLPLGVCLTFSLMGDQTMYSSLAAHTDVVGISIAAVGVMLGVNRLARIPANPFGGLLADRFGRRWPFIAGLLLGVLSTAISAVAHGFWPLLGGRILWGLAWTLINMSALSMLLDLTIQANRGRIAGFFNAAYLIGLSSTAFASGFLVDALGFRPALWLGAGVTAAGVLIALVALPETAQAGAAGRRRTFLPALSALPFLRQLDPRILAVTVMYMITNFAGNGVVMSTVGLLLRTRFGESVPLGNSSSGVVSAAGTLLGLGPFLGMLAGPLAGRLSDARRGRWPVIAGGFVLGAAAFGLLAADGRFALIVAGIVLVSVADGILLPTMVAQAGDVARAGQRGSQMGLYATGGDIGSAAGPFAAYALARLVDLHWAYAICGGLYVLALGLTLVMNRRHGGRSGQDG